MIPVRGDLRDIVDSSSEVLTFAELGRGALDGLGRVLGCSLTSMAHCQVDDEIDIVGGSDLEILDEYRREWFAVDPANNAIERQGDAPVVPVGRLPEWKDMQRHPLYAEWAPRYHVSFMLHLQLGEVPYRQAGATNVFLLRSKSDGEFGERDILTVAQVLPALQAAAARCKRVATMSGTAPFLESLLEEAEGRARIALRADGHVVWVSRAAERLLAGHLGQGQALPAALVEAASGVTSRGLPSTTVRLQLAGQKPVTAEVRRATATTGEVFASIDLRPQIRALSPELQRRFCLTPAEADVLADIAEGRSNAEIAGRRFVSVTTVRTHVAHILSKLGVHSRLQACLLVRASL